MIQYTTGNLFGSSAEALVNSVNTVGLMGKGIALQFKRAYPHIFKGYRQACLSGQFQTGQVLAALIASSKTARSKASPCPALFAATAASTGRPSKG